MTPDDPALQSFPLIWRFTDAKCCQLNSEEFRRLRPLPEEESLRQWAHLVYPGTDPASRHLVRLFCDNRISLPSVPTFRSETDAEMAEVPATLQRFLSTDRKAETLFFWDATLAVRTDLELFIDHWDDFCYPSDDSNVLVLPDLPKAVMYRDDRWFVLDRIDGKPLFPTCRS